MQQKNIDLKIVLQNGTIIGGALIERNNYMKKQNNVYVLIDIFAPKDGLEIYQKMQEKYSPKQAITWLRKRVSQFKVDQNLLKRLEETGRLMPIRDLFNSYYTKDQLMQYYLETIPRG